VTALEDLGHPADDAVIGIPPSGSFRLLLGTNPLPMWVYVRDSLRFLEVNDAAVRRYGYSREQFLAMRVSDIRTVEEFWPLEINLRSDQDTTYTARPWHHRTAAGEELSIEITSHVVNWDGQVAVLDSVLDLGLGQPEEWADDLLGNMAGGPAFLEELISALERPDCRVAVVAIAFDRIERIGGIAGVTAMYAVMEKAAARVHGACASGDLLARIGSRTFAVLHCLGTETAEAFAVKMIDDLGATVELAELGEVELAPAVGVRVAEDSERNAEVVLRDALAAMGEATASDGTRLVVFDALVPDRPRLRFELEQALRQGVDEGQLLLHYQPIVDLRSDLRVGYEALVRWERPGHGLVGPVDFVEIAEHSGLIGPLGAWVFARSLDDFAAIRSVGPDAFIALNLSPYQLADRELARSVISALDEAGVEPSSVCLELTETAMVSARHDAASHEQLLALRRAGVRVAIDDFGMGYSALSYLTDLPVDILKIDRSFVSRLGMMAADLILVEAVIRLAHELRLTVIAEGVETAEQLRLLRSLGADAAQGYLFARPAPLEEILAESSFGS
jgi:EAL domain-containing protein (putative c-di-GMP-specific phosphodiesterase class I)/GGDEF domain-containing protein